jgi:ferredoxin
MWHPLMPDRHREQGLDRPLESLQQTRQSPTEQSMKVIIDRQRCVGHARCEAVAPELYELDDDGFIASDGFDVAEGTERAARNGAKACPERIIRTMGDPTGTDWPPAAHKKD